MIREKAIFSKIIHIKFSDQQIFDIAVSGFRPSKCPCPVCGAIGCFHKIQSYERDMISILNGKRVNLTVSVPRFLCESCGHTHAVIPDILIPFGSYSLRFILTILRKYLLRSCTVSAFCEHWGIAISTLYGWIHLFTDQYNIWCCAIDRTLWLCQDALDDVFSSASFPSGFYQRFGFSFLQHRKTSPASPMPRTDRRRRASST